MTVVVEKGKGMTERSETAEAKGTEGGPAPSPTGRAREGVRLLLYTLDAHVSAALGGLYQVDLEQPSWAATCLPCHALRRSDPYPPTHLPSHPLPTPPTPSYHHHWTLYYIRMVSPGITSLHQVGAHLGCLPQLSTEEGRSEWEREQQQGSYKHGHSSTQLVMVRRRINSPNKQ